VYLGEKPAETVEQAGSRGRGLSSFWIKYWNNGLEAVIPVLAGPG